ncbi:MAG: hypothetical protein EA401_14735 [Planctomycetota bacterium]|nr:MAG: hypothetical protein EA401_14735 [Planctomycetota bacterium]
MMDQFKVWLLALAGLCYVIAAVLRWRALAQDAHAPRPWLLLATGITAHVCATIMAVASSGAADFTYAALGSLLAALAMLVGTRFMAVHTPGLLLLPVGIMACLVAVFAAVDRSYLSDDIEQRSLLFYVHIIFMSANLAAMLLASAAAGLYLAVSWQLKAASHRALRLPQLPPLAHLAQRSLLVALAMQLGGVVSGAVAIHPESDFSPWHPTVILACVAIIVMLFLLSVHALQRIGWRGLCWGIMVLLMVEVAALVTLMMVDAHG